MSYRRRPVSSVIKHFLDSDFLRNDEQGSYAIKLDTFEKRPYFVIPAEAGIQKVLKGLDSRFRRNDDLPNFGRNSKVSALAYFDTMSLLQNSDYPPSTPRLKTVKELWL